MEQLARWEAPHPSRTGRSEVGFFSTYRATDVFRDLRPAERRAVARAWLSALETEMSHVRLFTPRGAGASAQTLAWSTVCVESETEMAHLLTGRIRHQIAYRPYLLPVNGCWGTRACTGDAADGGRAERPGSRPPLCSFDIQGGEIVVLRESAEELGDFSRITFRLNAGLTESGYLPRTAAVPIAAEDWLRQVERIRSD